MDWKQNEKTRVYAVVIVIVIVLATFFYMTHVQKTIGLIRGTVTRGPVYPGPCGKDVPCYVPYAAFGVKVYDWTGTFVIASALTDSHGVYQIAVPAGQYIMYTNYTEIGGLKGGAPVKVIVTPNEIITVDISVDTGIR